MKKLFISLLTLLTACMVNAESWIDVTDSYVLNPNYDNANYAYWLGTQLSGYNPKSNAEHYSKTYDTYQTINGLAAGKYRVSLSAFYRSGTSDQDYSEYSGSNAADYQYASLYATSSVNTYSTPIALLSSGALQTSLGGGTANVGWGYYVPNNMEAAYYWFQAGYYLNTVECEVGSDGALTIGIKKNHSYSNDWTCIDTWKLEYWGTVTQATSVSLSESSLALVTKEMYQLNAVVLPSNATYHTVTWSSSDDNVATVDQNGNVTAVSAGTATITAAAKDGSGKNGTCKVTVTASSQATAGDFLINEIMVANGDYVMDPSFNYGSWIELYNITNKGLTLNGLYISDDAKNLKKFQLTDGNGILPANKFLNIWFDHNTFMSPSQVNFSLDYDGGTIIISDGTNIIAQQDYPAAITRTSYARTTDGGTTWGITATPTPAATNANTTIATAQLAAPVVDKDGGLFQGSFQVSVNIPDGATLRYTTDGTTPTLSNGETSSTGLLTVDNKTTIYRFRLFKDGYLPSPVVTRSYIYKDMEYVFPVISIVTANDHIFGQNYGIFVQGVNGCPGNGQSSNCNWNMDWERPVNFEYMTADGKYALNQEVDMAACGGWSRAWTPHSFKLKADKFYDGKNSMDYDFFPSSKPFLKHKTLQIRNGGNDNGCRIKDPALQEIVRRSGLYLDCQSWQPVHVFIDGTYYNVLNMREPNNKHYAYSNYGIDTDEMDQFEMSPDSGYVQMEGTEDAYLKWYDLSATASTDNSYKQICQLVDMDEYINYMATEFYLGGTDWPQNNVKGFRDVNDGKFHFSVFDLDGTLATTSPFTTFQGKQNYTFDYLYGVTGKTSWNTGDHRSGEIKFVTIFLNMLNNATFRKQFIDTYCLINGSVYTPERVDSIVNEMATYMNKGMSLNGGSPWSTANSLVSSFTSGRQNTMMDALKSFSLMNLTDATAQTANIKSNIDQARILYNNLPIPLGKLSGSVFSPITLKAVAPAGYTFKGWSGSATTTKSVFAAGSSWKYYDKGTLDGTSWNSSSYADGSWSQGNAPIGYGKSQTTTVSTTRLSTYYFRKSFTLSGVSSSDTYSLNYSVDDGMIVYVNGTEAGRYNMPSGTVSFSDVASTYAVGNPDTGSMTIPSNLFVNGTNVVSVEVHNNSTTSSDIYWDASLDRNVIGSDGNYLSTDSVYTCPTTGAINVTAVWEKMTDEEKTAQGILTAPVIVNEVSAANAIYISDYAKKSDWMELYNTTDSAVDIAGYYLSDKADIPQKYQIPIGNVTLNTVVPANGYKVIWCDNQENKSEYIHTPFKLSSDSGCVMISKYNGSAVECANTLFYTTHQGDESVGRYPDGSNSVYVMNKPTPLAANIYTSNVAEYVHSYVVDDVKPISIVHDGGMSIAYVSGVINVKSENADITSVKVYSLSGMNIPSTETRNTGSFVTVYLGSLPAGIYIAKATDADGDTCRMKFVIR